MSWSPDSPGTPNGPKTRPSPHVCEETEPVERALIHIVLTEWVRTDVLLALQGHSGGCWRQPLHRRKSAVAQGLVKEAHIL